MAIYFNFKFYSLSVLLWSAQRGICQKCVFMWENGTELSESIMEFNGIILSPISDTDEPGKSLLVLKTQDVTNIQTITNKGGRGSPNSKDYVSVVFIDTMVQVTLSDKFTVYEEHETAGQISIQVYFNCASGSTKDLEINQPITDTNNHFPTFVGVPYQYTLSMPFPKNIPINMFGAIAARDIDFSEKKITFYIDPDDPISQVLEAAWSSIDTADSKLHHATLTTKTLMNLRNDVTFTLYATDSGLPSNKTANTSVTIVIDKTDSILRFAKPIYIADYTDLDPLTANGTVFIFHEGNITLSGGSDATIEYFLAEQSGVYQKNFAPLISSDHSQVHIILIEPPDDLFNESFALLTLTAKKAGVEESTVLHISLPGRFKSNVSVTTVEPVTSTTGSSGMSEEPCVSTDCKITVIILSIFLAAVTTGLVTTIVLSLVLRFRVRRQQLKSSESINGFAKREEMLEIQRNSIESSMEPARRSVTFNDTIEEIKVARL